MKREKSKEFHATETETEIKTRKQKKGCGKSRTLACYGSCIVAAGSRHTPRLAQTF
jgi:hypothetical protein